MTAHRAAGVLEPATRGGLDRALARIRGGSIRFGDSSPGERELSVLRVAAGAVVSVVDRGEMP